jgi:cell division protein FtsI/penicillin-binding protein 2
MNRPNPFEKYHKANNRAAVLVVVQALVFLVICVAAFSLLMSVR